MTWEGETLKQCVVNILKINFLISVFHVTNQFVLNVQFMDLTENIKFKLQEGQYRL